MTGYLNIALHDIHAGNAERIREIAEQLDDFGVSPLSLLVVPHYEREHRLTEKSPLYDFLQERVKRGDEIVFHGMAHINEKGTTLSSPYYHFFDKYLSRGCAEYCAFKPGDKNEIGNGLAELGALGLSAKGAIAPGWLGNRHFFDACREVGLLFTTSIFNLWDLQNGKKFFSPVMTTLNSGSTKEYQTFRSIYKKSWFLFRRLAFWRVAIHPNDLDHDGFSQIGDTLSHWAKKRKVICFEHAIKALDSSWLGHSVPGGE